MREVLMTVLAMLISAAMALGSANPVSPGHLERFAPISGECPAFSWTADSEAGGYELVIYRVDSEQESSATVLTMAFPAGATSWTPSTERCLAPGERYAWSVRALDLEGRGGWSEVRLFEVPMLPSRLELAEALEIVRSYVAAAEPPANNGGGSEAGLSSASSPKRPPSGRTPSAQDAASLTAAVAALRAEQPDASGDTAGLIGISNSSEGAGILAANVSAAGGADLVLDGSAQSEGDTLLDESGITVGGPAFDLRNPTDDLALSLNGAPVLALSCPNPDEVPTWNGSTWVCGPGDSPQDVFQSFTVSSGTSPVADSPTDSLIIVDGANISTEGDSSSDSLTLSVVGGPGSGLDADTLDGLESSAFAIGSHTHFGQVWTGSGGDHGMRVGHVAASGIKYGLYGYSDSTSGRGVAGIAQSGGGQNIGVLGTTTSSDGVGGWFENQAGGDHLVAGSAGESPVFRVSAGGEVVATAYQGDGSQLAGVVTGGQSCVPGLALVGINADGSIACGGTTPAETLSVLDIASTSLFWPSTAIGSDGLPITSYRYTKDTSGAAELRVAHCDEVFCTSATVQTVDTSALSVGIWSSIAIGSDGLPIISYTDSTNDALKVAHCDDLQCSSATLQVVDQGESVTSSIAVGTDGLPVISYPGGENDVLKVAHCDDLLCASATLSTIDTGDVFIWTSIAIGSDGLPVISYFTDVDDDLRVAHCDDPRCTSANVESVDKDGDVGRYSSIAIGSDGLPVISYSGGPHDLKVAHCDDVLCSSGSIETLENNGFDMVGTSIAVGIDGLPVVAFGRQVSSGGDAGGLRVAHCDDLLCQSFSLNVVDLVDVRYPSVAIGVDGLPFVTYAELDDHSLKAAHCAYIDCF
jgi:predicted regulator of Ras-like GTPase activity (Roadblock/LC7/MglB family)